ncbi:CDF family zinc transporter ZitB [Tatumella terrea]|uniref:CDF family zinc transporter ZitB n=1 Tax=Tatumella TaxID=82986 RepID=UPI001BAE8DB2|nr:CDF family zinc transporter ZitB [Tatumella sp. JGM118]MBS0909756.1 CDF family zinc transporter ZitB [Tatumella sp. JGM118]
MAHSHQHAPASVNRSRLLAAFIVTTLFMLVEVIGGWLSGSLALLADAGHMLTDAGALLLALLATHFSQRTPEKHQTFGLLRLTTVAAFVNALALLVIILLIVWEALLRFRSPQPVAGGLMLGIAVAGLLANILCFYLLKQGQGKENLNVRAAALHVLGDLLGSAGAIVAALLILWTGWTPFDPILSILVSLLVLNSARQLIRDSLRELLEHAPASIDIDKLSRQLTLNIAEIRNVHHVHLWQVGEKTLLTLHARVIPNYQQDALLGRIHNWLKENYSITHATVQLEYQECTQPECQLGTEAESGNDDHHHSRDYEGSLHH